MGNWKKGGQKKMSNRVEVLPRKTVGPRRKNRKGWEKGGGVGCLGRGGQEKTRHVSGPFGGPARKGEN